MTDVILSDAAASVREQPAAHADRFTVRVTAARLLSPTVRYLELVPVDASRRIRPEAGAHIDLHLSPTLVRQYSLCNGPADVDVLQLAIKLEERSRGGSAFAHQQLNEGDEVQVSGPRNHFALVTAGVESGSPRPDDEGQALLLAGGIGITPLLSMARHLHAQGRRFALHYFVRSTADAAFEAQIGDSPWHDRVVFHIGLSAEQTRQAIDAALSEVAPGAHAYVCGPRPFMEAAIAAGERQLGPSHVHSEFFSGDPDAIDAPTGAFIVRCAKSGKDLPIGERDRIVDVLSRNGIGIDVMCEQGVCGTCLTGVIAGRPDHRDSYLSDEERACGTQMLVCCSRSLDPILILDL